MRKAVFHNKIYSRATSIPGATYNLGVSQIGGSSIGYVNNMKLGEGLIVGLYQHANVTYGVRASTYSTTGTAKISTTFYS